MIDIVPLISGTEAGPLGIVHLPRLWLKLLLADAGRLPEGYRHGSGGTDEGVLDFLGISAKQILALIASEKPEYLELERWVRGHARDLSPEAIERFNAATVTFDMPEPRLTAWRERFGITDPGISKAVMLNQLDDWEAFAASVESGGGKIVPAISTSVCGPLGVMHLPRLWAKVLLFGAGRLPEEYRHGVGGFDMVFLASFGIDHDAFHTYVVSEKPAYLAIEAWVRANAKSLDAGTIKTFNDRMRAANMPPATLEGVHARLAILDASFTNGIMLNDLDDWHSLHASITATPQP